MNKWMAFACLAAPGLVAAAQVDVKFSGHVSYLGLVTCSAYTDGTCQGQVAQSPTELEFMDGVIRWGDSFSGSFRYDSAMAPYSSLGSDSYQYYRAWAPDVALDMQLQMGAVSFPPASLPPVIDELTVVNYPSNDAFVVEQGWRNDDTMFAHLSVSFHDATGTAFDKAVLPTSLDPDLLTGGYSLIVLTATDLRSGRWIMVQSPVQFLEATLATPVPEPSTWSLMFLGVAGLLARRKLARKP